jgi:hypothetical protein
MSKKSSRRWDIRHPDSTSNFWTKGLSARVLRSRAVPTRPRSEKPRKSREGKRSKRLKRQQPQRKEKYRKRQCRANHEQHHEVSKLSATHDVQRQRSGKKFRGGASHTAPNPTPRKGVTAIMLRIRLRRYRDALAKNNSAIAPILFGLALHRRTCRVLHLDPVPRSAGAVGRAKALRYDAFEPELARVAKHDVARFDDVLG